MKRQASPPPLWVDSPLLHRDYLLEVASHLDEVSLILLCFTSRLTKGAVLDHCRMRNSGLLRKEHACEWASSLGYLSAFIWFAHNDCPMRLYNCLLSAVVGGHLNLVKWFDESYSVQVGHQELMCCLAASNGRLDVMHWLVETGRCVGNRDVFASAAEGGNLEIVKLLREKGCPWDVFTCADAAKGGHLEVLKWLHGEGCPWDNRTSFKAAAYGHLELLKWVRENACPVDWFICAIAVRHGQVEVLRWAREEGYGYDEALLLEEAGVYGQRDMAEWIRANPFRAGVK
jgi:hypothetical protein